MSEPKRDFETLQKSFTDTIDDLPQQELWPEGAPGWTEEKGWRNPRIALLPKQPGMRGMVLVCPGGGYRMKAAYEGRVVAEAFHKLGFNAAVLDYRCAPYTPLEAHADATRALRVLRAHAQEWGIDPAHIAIGGFSAGGHLSAMAATCFDEGHSEAADPIERMSSRPDLALICYGGFNFMGRVGETLAGQLSRAEQLRLSPEYNISFTTPPFFIWATRPDQMVPVGGVYDLARALDVYEIPYELHVFPNGPHGVGLADGSSPVEPGNPHTARWLTLCAEWMEQLGF